MSDVITLIKTEETTTAMGGRESKVTNEKKIFAEKKSVRSNEFYQAYQSGLEVSIIFKVWATEYDDQLIIKYNDKYYTVVRTYEIGEHLEITCKRRKGLLEEAAR